VVNIWVWALGYASREESLVTFGGKIFLRPQASVISMLAKKSNIITALYYKWQGRADDPYYGRPRVSCFLITIMKQIKYY
jgi:hypothetical protein